MNDRVDALKLGGLDLPCLGIPKYLAVTHWPAAHQRLNDMPARLQKGSELTPHQAG
ncbi:MAG: hypothetical protein KatS3mg059_0963 [Thermomicrobiales bacterium]|nr:MAG: hypothetical protein KatS3mg059_0963 [Thermomicrobiales bacterium]